METLALEQLDEEAMNMEIKPLHELQLFSTFIPVKPLWDSVEKIRSSALNMSLLLYPNYDLGHAVCMASSELLENAVKYNDAFNMHSPVTYRMYGSVGKNGYLIVEVTNRTVDKHMRDLKEWVDWIKSFPNPQEAYIARISDYANVETESSRLGLIRIAYEAQADLDVEEHLDQRVTVAARFNFESYAFDNDEIELEGVANG